MNCCLARVVGRCRMEYSERLEIWWQYGKKGCAFCETFTAVLPDREESAEDWNRRVENEIKIYELGETVC